MSSEWKQTLSALRDKGYICHEDIYNAMSSVDRADFIDLPVNPYHDTPCSIGWEQTISAPHMVAMMLEYLAIKPGENVLEIGTGSGFNAACLAKLVGKNGHVHTCERINALHQLSQQRLSHLSNVSCYLNDGFGGLSSQSPYDAILITCCAKDIPRPCLEQLTSFGGRLLMPLQRRMGQVLILVSLRPDQITLQTKGNVCFVPMLPKIVSD